MMRWEDFAGKIVKVGRVEGVVRPSVRQIVDMYDEGINRQGEFFTAKR